MSSNKLHYASVAGKPNIVHHKFHLLSLPFAAVAIFLNVSHYEKFIGFDAFSIPLLILAIIAAYFLLGKTNRYD